MTQLLAQLVAHPQRVGAGPIALVDKRHPWHVVPAHLAIDSERLTLDPGHRTQDQDGPIQNPQAALHLDGEVHMTRGIDDIHMVLVPLAVGGRARDGDAALALQVHGVHLGADAVLAFDIVDGVDTVGIEQNALGQRGLTAVNMR